MNKDKSLKNQSEQDNEIDDGPVSLSLLDWRRRERFVGNKGKKKQERVVETASLSKSFPPGIDATLISWDKLNRTAKHDPDKKLTLEPPRNRHSNVTYGHLCNSLMNCLRSKGRVFARHEFFYSDIDKAW